MHEVDSINHLFIPSKRAKKIWIFFAIFFHIPTNFISVKHVISAWIMKSTNLSQFEIWKAGMATIYVGRCGPPIIGMFSRIKE